MSLLSISYQSFPTLSLVPSPSSHHLSFLSAPAGLLVSVQEVLIDSHLHPLCCVLSPTRPHTYTHIYIHTHAQTPPRLHPFLGHRGVVVCRERRVAFEEGLSMHPFIQWRKTDRQTDRPPLRFHMHSPPTWACWWLVCLCAFAYHVGAGGFIVAGHLLPDRCAH